MMAWPNWPVTAWTTLTCGAVSVGLIVWMLIGAAEKRSATPDGPWLLRAPLLPLVLTVVSGLIGLYSLVLLLAFGAEDFSLPDRSNVANPVIVAATLIAGVLTAAYAVLKFRAHLLSEARGKIDAQEDQRAENKHRADQEFALIERFSKAVELLATEQPISRIAGAHLVLALGDEWEAGNQRCLDVLTSHLRALSENNSFDNDDGSSRGLREEVRLITAELVRRLADPGKGWMIKSWDFRGAVLGDVSLTVAEGLKSVDFAGARILGSLTLTREADAVIPKLSDIECDGDLAVNWESGRCDRSDGKTREFLDISSVRIRGSLAVSGHNLDCELRATDAQVDGEVSLAFEEFASDIYLDQIVVGEEVRIGSDTLKTTFAIPASVDASNPTVSLTLAESTFGRLRLRNAVRGPRLDLSGATGRVDLSHSRFPAEVSANGLDASAGLILTRARFDAALLLDGATLPEAMEVDGLQLSREARSGLESSDFPFLDRLFDSAEAGRAPEPPIVSIGATKPFDWRALLKPMRGDYPDLFVEQLEARLSRLEVNLPIDWQARDAFAARVMSSVSRAAAVADVADSDAEHVQAVLRHGLGLASEGGSSR